MIVSPYTDVMNKLLLAASSGNLWKIYRNYYTACSLIGFIVKTDEGNHEGCLLML